MATEDLRGGENFAEKISDAITRFDRLLVLLSKHSLNSEWVEREVNIALEQERRRGEVIIPLNQDDAFQNQDKEWVKKLKDNKHIIGFKTRGQSQNYFDAMSKLLRALEKDRTSTDNV